MRIRHWYLHYKLEWVPGYDHFNPTDADLQAARHAGELLVGDLRRDEWLRTIGFRWVSGEVRFDLSALFVNFDSDAPAEPDQLWQHVRSYVERHFTALPFITAITEPSASRVEYQEEEVNPPPFLPSLFSRLFGRPELLLVGAAGALAFMVLSRAPRRERHR